MSFQLWARFLYLSSLAALFTACAFAQSMDDVAILKDFDGHIAKYLEVRKQAGVANKSSNSPDKLADQKQQAAQKIRESRSAAKQGDIFTPQIAAYFKKRITATLQGRDGAKIRASLRHAEPLPEVSLRVNSKYPGNLPLQSTPPTLLLNLPRLPSELQYRIVGHSLVLYDVPSNLIADFLPGAIPAS
jgi:hypothetical protein